jgi:hypothetical protein
MSLYEDRKKDLVALLEGDRRPRRYGELRAAMGRASWVKALVDEGAVESLGGAMYRAVDHSADTTWDTMALVSAMHSDALICLDTAAVYWGLADFNPDSVHVAFPKTKRIPVHPDLPVRGYRWTQKWLEHGVDAVEVGGVSVRITSPARTVVDFLRRMNRTGSPEEAVQVLKGYFAKHPPALLTRLAVEMRAEDVVNPYVHTVMGFRSF